MVELDTQQAQRRMEAQAKLLSPQALSRVNARALNRAGRAAGVVFSKEIRQTIAVKAATVKDAIKTSKATPSRQEFTFDVSRSPLRLELFSHSQTRRGISVRLLKGRARTIISDAFLVPRWGMRAFRRLTPQRAPLRLMWGPSIGSQADRAWPAARKRAVEVMTQRHIHEINREVEKANR
jgi:hypothetical protein